VKREHSKSVCCCQHHKISAAYLEITFLSAAVSV
jgi:hypothetical protein